MVQDDTLQGLTSCYTETSLTLLTLELSISPVKVREISNLTKSWERDTKTTKYGDSPIGIVPTEEPTTTLRQTSPLWYSGIDNEFTGLL